MSGLDDKSIEERRKYVMSFNSTMVKIWREKIAWLGVVDTGKLFQSTVGITVDADEKFSDVKIEQAFNVYGIFQDLGTGKEVYRGNNGDIGRDKNRERRKWYSTKYFASVHNIQEFFADSFGKQFCTAISNALNPDSLRKEFAP